MESKTTEQPERKRGGALKRWMEKQAERPLPEGDWGEGYKAFCKARGLADGQEAKRAYADLVCPISGRMHVPTDKYEESEAGCVNPFALELAQKWNAGEVVLMTAYWVTDKYNEHAVVFNYAGATPPPEMHDSWNLILGEDYHAEFEEWDPESWTASYYFDKFVQTGCSDDAVDRIIQQMAGYGLYWCCDFDSEAD